MKLRHFVIIIIIAMLAVFVAFFVKCYSEALDIPALESDSLELGEVVNENLKEDGYEMYIQKLKFSDTIDNTVNGYIDSLVQDFKEANTDTVFFKKDKALFKNIIDTYAVNDSIISIKVTSISKKAYEDFYTTNVKAFNYNIDTESSISLDDIFGEGYKDVISNYTDNYLLKHTEIEFYDGTQMLSVTYNSLIEYNASTILTASNYEITDEEYEALFKTETTVDPSKKMVAITFDDGPHATNTEEILQILSNYNAKATFFMVGQNVVNYKDIVKKVYDSGNEIGIHTWDHAQLTTLSYDEIVSEVQKTSDAIYDITGYRPTLVRPPYGSFNSTVKSALSEYSLILWNIDSLDWKSRDENQIVPLVMGDVQDGDIILLHDIHSTTVPAVERIVSELTDQGYQLVTVSELLDAKGYDRGVTQVFYSGRQ